jgi:hypothetical protein
MVHSILLLGILLIVIILDSGLIVILSVVKLIVVILSLVMLNVKLAFRWQLLKVKQSNFLEPGSCDFKDCIFQPFFSVKRTHIWSL